MLDEDGRRTRATGLFWATITWFVAYAVLILILPAQIPSRALISDGFFAACHPLAALLLWSAAQQGQDERRRRGLELLAWSQVIGSINSVIWILSSAGYIPLNAPEFQWVGVSMTILSTVGAVWLVPRRSVAGSTVVVPLVDASLLALASTAIGWQFVGMPLLVSGRETATAFLWFAGMTAADAFTALVALSAWAYPTPRVRPSTALLIAAAYILSACLDVVIEVRTLNQTYASGGLLDILFALAVALIALAGYLEHFGRSRSSGTGERRAMIVRTALPVVAVTAILLPSLFAPEQATGMLRLVPWSLLVALFGLLLWRFHLIESAAERAITERAIVERDLRLAQQFESLGRYAASVAHDFNNLLTALLAQVHVAKLDPQRAEILGSMQDTINSGTTLVRRLMQMSRGGVTPMSPVELGGAARNVAVTLSRLLPPNVHLQLDLATDPVWVLLRPGDADQLLLNLVVNARDALPHGGHIRVTLRAVDGQAVLSVSDDGVGIPPEVRARIFEPFYTTKGAHGTGLGLATVHQIVTQSSGTIELTSELGQGTTFTMRWRLSDSTR